MDWSKATKRWDVTVLMAVLVVQLLLEGYAMVTDNGTVEIGGHLAFATLWIVFGYVAFREYGTTPRSLLTVLLLVGGGLLNMYALLAANPIVGSGVAEILEGIGVLLYVSQMKATGSKPFQRA